MTVQEKAIAYYRVSTQKQGKSGLGLRAQTSAVSAHARSRGLRIVREFKEVETGTSKRERTAIFEAIEAAKEQDAVLLIAKLDRLSRNLHFVTGLMESGVRFVACDMPDVNDMTIHIMAAVAQAEAQAISERTKVALAAARDRGTKLGKPENLTLEAQRKGAEANRSKAEKSYRKVSGYISTLRSQGMSLRAIAGRLNEEGHRTRRGKEWRAPQVRNVLTKYPPTCET